jgi:hypothetical protein
MKISNSKLRRIIKEELIREVSSERETEPNSVSDAIEHGNNMDESLRIDMRQKAINDFARLYAESLLQQKRRLSAENPDIGGFEDLSQDKINEIKELAARSALEEYKRTHTNTELIADYIARIERIIGKPLPPTLKQLVIRYAKDFAYQFVFGFLDNLILILAGAALDDYVKMVFGAKRLQRILSPDDLDFITDGIGNAISDAVGDLGGGAVERNVDNWSWLNDAATDDQVEIATQFQRLMARTATFTGVVLGCVVAIPIGILILKGLTAIGATAAAGFGLAAGVTTAGLGLLAAGIMGKTTYDEFMLLNKAAKETLDSSLGVIMSRVYRKRRIRGDELPPRSEYDLSDFEADVENSRSDDAGQSDVYDDPPGRALNIQLIWNDEMDLTKLLSHQDIDPNHVWNGVDMLSKSLGLYNPNRTQLDESRLLKLAGVLK